MRDDAGHFAGRHRKRRASRITRRGRFLIGAGSLAVVAAALFLLIPRASGIVIPSDACASPPPLETYRGVTLQPLAMVAFKRAERLADRRIPVVWSYRSCAEQRLACRNICGAAACPGRCAPPGKSWHQLGAAIDTNQHALDTPEIVAALEAAGWCQSVPESDPGHFSFDGCH